MAKYLLVYHGGSMEESEEAMAEQMAAWGVWFGELGPAVVDGGNPTGESKTLSTAGVAGGGGANPTTGYSLINAENIEDAVQKSKGCPVLKSGGTIEVCETIDVSM